MILIILNTKMWIFFLTIFKEQNILQNETQSWQFVFNIFHLHVKVSLRKQPSGKNPEYARAWVCDPVPQ